MTMQKLLCLSILMFSVFYLAVFSGDVLLLSYAQESNTKTEYLSLEDAVEIAINNNPIIKSKGHSIEEAKGRIRQANLLPNPEIELFTEEMPSNEMGLGRSQNMVSLSQRLEIGGKRRLRTGVAKKEKDILGLDLLITIADITAKVKKAFFDALTSQDELEFAKEALEIAESLKAISDEKFNAGIIARIEVLKANVEFSNAKMKVIVTERNRLNSIKKLQTIMGTPNISLNELYPISIVDTPLLKMEKLEDMLLTNYPAVQAQKKIVELSLLKVKEARKNAIPDINASVGYKRLSETDEDTIQAGIKLPLPIFNRNQGKITEANAFSDKAKDDEIAIRNELLLLLNKAFSSYISSREQVSCYINTIIPQAEESLNIAKQGYRRGEFDYIVVLDAQRTLANTRISYIKIMNELFSSIAEIEKFVGVKISDIK